MTPGDGRREQALGEIREVYQRTYHDLEGFDTGDPYRYRWTDRLKWAAYRRLLERNGLSPLGKRDVLDVGCQWGTWLALCRQEWGQESGRLCGVDLMEDCIHKGRELYDFLDLQQGSGDRLPAQDNSFDLVHQGMLFSSVLDAPLRHSIAAEMRRVVRPGGCIIWYDFLFNPINRNTIGMTLRRVRACFPGWRVVYGERVTLAPPLSRIIGKISAGAVKLLTRLKVFNSHHLILLRPGQPLDPR